MFRRSCLFRLNLNKVCTLSDAISDIGNGSSIAVGGFGCSGVPYGLIRGIKEKGVKGLKAYSDSAGIDGWGLGILMDNQQLSYIACSYAGVNKKFTQQYLNGDLELEFCPQGTLAERMRAGGAGIPAFYTATGYGTQRQEGGQIIRYNKDGTPCKLSEPKETRSFDGRWYVLERSLRTDFGLVRAWKADKAGNLIFRALARNFNVPVGQCGRCVIAEVEEIVENGQLDPNDIHLPGIYVKRVVKTPSYEIPIEQRTVRSAESHGKSNAAAATPEAEVRQRIARRAALEFADGMYVNLGIGIPTEAANYIPSKVSVVLQSENGLLGMGPFPTEDRVDPEWINAGKQTISHLPGAALFDSATSFAMIRGGHMDLTMLGALEVAANGDLANWGIPGRLVKGPGGAMDLVASGARVVITMTHCNKKGAPKILSSCMLPVTGRKCVSRIITERAVIDVENESLVLKEVAEGLTVEDVQKATGAPLIVDKNVKKMPLAPL